MTRRGEIISTFALALSLVMAVASLVCAFTGNPEYGAVACGLACFLVLLVIYLEVYSRRG